MSDRVEIYARAIARTKGYDPDQTVTFDGETVFRWQLFTKQAAEVTEHGDALKLMPKRAQPDA